MTDITKFLSEFEQHVTDTMNDIGSMMSYMDERGVSYRTARPDASFDEHVAIEDAMIDRCRSALRNEAQDLCAKLASSMLTVVADAKFGTFAGE